jgi:hypothetical protein
MPRRGDELLENLVSRNPGYWTAFQVNVACELAPW